ncbi:hypothetical protein EJ05DRAFT_542249 [Pseudovirgaria hyperparasitica]|uniref:Zn(2)-C6 fungal-type domain-containing protein n=1 Tax=Pseudovirgaria hyperparasitica TaxID=470096 RepID=A0A6A6VT49_9PEZI|nr:uncharacterized protein EJ05DRAFT_542249 [Pseudovirgaria hyperparasitica]KAF2753059.1 hypothetical protein EJ05DRAFT_542249 [Pseudovirgaria hyperparasitica]
MPSEIQKRKRPVAACQPCYSKKQKCDHQYPCSNCVRRRLPELCNYTFADNDNAQSKPKSAPQRSPKRPAHGSQSPTSSDDLMDSSSSSPLPALDLDSNTPYEANLSSCLGYFEGSKSNLFSLMDKFDLLNTKELDADLSGVIPDANMPEIKLCLDMFPKRPIINCLVQHFIKEVNWLYEMIHPTLFLNKYEQWWKSVPGSSVDSLDFGILILRICAYSAQFIPSGTHSGDTIRNVPVNTVRQHCDKLATRLWRLVEQIEGPKSLTCVHHLFYHACYMQNEGSMRDAWYILGNAIRVTQDLGMHLEEPLRSQTPLNDLEKDMRRRAFWNLYIWDRFLSLVLDRSPCIPEEHYCSVDLPKMRILSGAQQNTNAPDVFTERILQAKLSKLWFSLVPANRAKPDIYDPSVAEEVYEKLCREFVAELPLVFSLQSPDTQWDQQIPMLARQRQTLKISVFVILCQLFQPLLHLSTEQIQTMPHYKRDLITTHRNHLVTSCVSLLEGVSQLHDLMGNTPARFHLLSFFSFEPAMLLAMYVMSTAMSHKALTKAREQDGRRHLFASPPMTPTVASIDNPKGVLTATECRVHIETALQRLTLLQESTMIARVSARKLKEVLAKLDSLSAEPNIGSDDEAIDNDRLTPATRHTHSTSVSSALGKKKANSSTTDTVSTTNWLSPFEVPAVTTTTPTSTRQHGQSVGQTSRRTSRPQLSRMHSFASMTSVSLDSPPVQGHSHGREMSTYRPNHQNAYSHSHSTSLSLPHAMILDGTSSPHHGWHLTSPPPAFSPNGPCLSAPVDGYHTNTFSNFSCHDSGIGDSVSSAHSSVHFGFDNGQWPALYDENEASNGLGVFVGDMSEQFVDSRKGYFDSTRSVRCDSGVGDVPETTDFDDGMEAK